MSMGFHNYPDKDWHSDVILNLPSYAPPVCLYGSACHPAHQSTAMALSDPDLMVQ